MRALAAALSLLLATGAFGGEPDRAPRSGSPPPVSAEAPTPRLTKSPELKRFVEAAYPEAAQAEGRDGTVTFALTIQADGSVTEVVVVKSAGADLDAAALAAVEGFEFSPAELDGKPGAVRITYDYVFTLETEVVAVPVPVAETPTGTLRGLLQERGTRAPLMGFAIRLPDLGRETWSDAQGEFEFESVPAGRVRLVVQDPSFSELEDEETVLAGQATEVIYRLDREGFDDTLSVVGRRPRKQVARRSLSMREIRTIPGTQGDALKVVQNLPGVARQTFSDDIVLRGGGRSQAYLDQHPIPLAFHFGGLRSTVSSGLIESIDLYPGNFGVEFGRVNGGVIDVQLRSPARDRATGFVEADLFDAGLQLEAPVGEHWSFAIAARRSYIDALLPLWLDAETLGNFKTSPVYYDAQLLVEGRYGKHTLLLTGLLSSDALELLFPAEGEESEAFRMGQDWWGGRAEWSYRASADVRNTLSVSYLVLDQSFGAVYGVDDAEVLDLREHRMSLRDTVDWRLSEWLGLRAGTDSELLIATYSGTALAPVREGESGENDEGFESEASDFRTRITTLSPSLWAEAELELGDLHVLPGLRLDYFGATEELVVQPRLTLRHEIHRSATLKSRRAGRWGCGGAS